MDYEIFKFRAAKKQEDETIDQFTTRLRKLAATCDFTSIDKEVKSAIIQNCSSKRLRRYVLLNNELTLAKLLTKGQAFELSESQATGIEKSLESTSISEEVVEAVGPSNRALLNNKHHIHVKILSRNRSVETVDVPGPITTISAQQKENHV